MRVVIQRVSRASVSVSGEMIASIEAGLLLLVGVGQSDTKPDAERLARRCAELRIFPDRDDRLNLSLLDVGGEALVVSQFTLLADTHKGRRPNFTQAAPPGTAQPLIALFTAALEELGVQTKTGRFGAMMQVELVNDGPVTLIVEDRKE